MREVDRVFRGFLGMAPEPDAPELGIAPVRRAALRRGELPLRRPPADAVPGEDQPLELPRLVPRQPGGLRRRRVRRGDAPAGRVVLVAVERADEAAVAHPAAGLGPEIGAQMRADRPGDADRAAGIAPGDDPCAQPGLPDERLPFQRRAAGDEVPALRERMERGRGIVLVSVGRHLNPRRNLSPAAPNRNPLAGRAIPAGRRGRW